MKWEIAWGPAVSRSQAVMVGSLVSVAHSRAWGRVSFLGWHVWHVFRNSVLWSPSALLPLSMFLVLSEILFICGSCSVHSLGGWLSSFSWVFYPLFFSALMVLSFLCTNSVTHIVSLLMTFSVPFYSSISLFLSFPVCSLCFTDSFLTVLSLILADHNVNLKKRKAYVLSISNNFIFIFNETSKSFCYPLGINFYLGGLGIGQDRYTRGLQSL